MTRSAAPDLTLVPPIVCWVPEYDYTLGPEVAEVSTLAGFPPDPEQQLVLDATFAVRGEKSAARDIGVECPRQNMKTGCLKQMALGWLYVLELPLVTWTAHEFATSQEAFRDMCELLESSPDLEREIQKISYGNGDEAIELTHDRRLRFRARTKSGGRGLTGNRVIFDEAMYVKGSHIGSLVPTLRAVPDPQVVFAGSAGFADSHEWRRLRDRGRVGGDPSLAYLAWASDLEPGGCADEHCTHRVGVSGCALDDVERLLRSNPAIGRRITLETLANDRRLMPPEQYAVETLGWWEPPADEVEDLVFEKADWTRIQDAKSKPGPILHMAAHTSPDRAKSAVAVAALRKDGRVHVEVIEHGPGTAWVAPYVTDRAERHRPVSTTIAGGMAAGSLAPELEPIPGFSTLNATEVRRACGNLFDLVKDGAVAHRSDERLAAALSMAFEVAHRSSTTGEWVFSAPVGVDLSTLYAVALAAWAAKTEAGFQIF